MFTHKARGFVGFVCGAVMLLKMDMMKGIGFFEEKFFSLLRRRRLVPACFSGRLADRACTRGRDHAPFTGHGKGAQPAQVRVNSRLSPRAVQTDF